MGNAWHVTPEQYAHGRPRDYGVPARPASLYVGMRDGCRLALDYYLPQPLAGVQAPAAFPVIIIFTPYYRRFALADAGSKTDPTPNACKYRDYFVPHGYALVVVDVRGTGASFGTRDSFRSPRERDDYREIADWIVQQPWCNGAIGATGISYLGAASDFLASTGHPAVKAIAPISAVWDTWSDHYYPGGLLLNHLSQIYDRMMTALDHDRRDLLGEFSYFSNPEFAGPQPVDDDADGELCRAAVREHAGNFRMPDFITAFPCRDDALLYDPDFTSASISPYHYRDSFRDDVAVLSISGWMDGAGYANGSIARFLTLDKNPRYLLLGDWDHGARTDTSPWRSSPGPQLNVLDEILRFFDHYLCHMNTGLGNEDIVHYFSVHEEAWHGAQTWPPQPDTTNYSLAGDGRLTTQGQPDGHDEFRANYAFGTGNHTRYERIAGYDCKDYYTDWQERIADLTCYTSDPLDAAAEVTGHACANLWLASSEPDAAIIVYLSEVTPDGRVHHVTEGLLRAIHRREAPNTHAYRSSWPYRTFSRADTERMPIDVAQLLRIPLLPVSWQFQRGSRIRLSIAASDVDHVIQLPYGRPPLLRIHHDAQHPSSLTLPTSAKP